MPADVHKMSEKLEDKKGIDNPYALAQWMKNKGYDISAIINKKELRNEEIDEYLKDKPEIAEKVYKAISDIYVPSGQEIPKGLTGGEDVNKKMWNERSGGTGSGIKGHTTLEKQELKEGDKVFINIGKDFEGNKSKILGKIKLKFKDGYYQVELPDGRTTEFEGEKLEKATTKIYSDKNIEISIECAKRIWVENPKVQGGGFYRNDPRAGTGKQEQPTGRKPAVDERDKPSVPYGDAYIQRIKQMSDETDKRIAEDLKSGKTQMKEGKIVAKSQEKPQKSSVDDFISLTDKIGKYDEKGGEFSKMISKSLSDGRKAYIDDLNEADKEELLADLRSLKNNGGKIIPQEQPQQKKEPEDLLNQFKISEENDINKLQKELNGVQELKAKGYTDISNKEKKLKEKIQQLKGKTETQQKDDSIDWDSGKKKSKKDIHEWSGAHAYEQAVENWEKYEKMTDSPLKDGITGEKPTDKTPKKDVNKTLNPQSQITAQESLDKKAPKVI